MIKIINKLEKSTIFWALIWLSLLFFILRLPSLIEPHWYSDEGVYQLIGIAMNHGHLLYRDIWDNKPPLLYVLYALFNGDQFGTRLASLVAGLAATWIFCVLSQKLFNNIKISIFATIAFIVLFATPFLEGNIANAENFMLFPIIAAALFIYQFSINKDQRLKTKDLIIAGGLLGIAFLLKIVAVFDLGAFLVFIIIRNIPEKLSFRAKPRNLMIQRSIGMTIGVLIGGFLTPILIATLYFFFNHDLGNFVKATFLGNIGYVGYQNAFIIPQGLLILKLLLLATLLLSLFFKRKSFSQPTLFILIWLAFSLFSVFFSQRPYTHYILVLLPSGCLLIGQILNAQKTRTKQILTFLLLAVVILLATTFNLPTLTKTLGYYQNAIFFITGKENVASYQSFFDPKTPRDYELASYIKTHTHPNDPVFIWGNNPQIYVLSKTVPINKYTVAYQIVQNEKDIQDTQKTLDTIKPKYVIIVSDAPNFPFHLIQYASKLALTKATIYERTF